MLKGSELFSDLRKIKKILPKDILEILVFGSFVRGKYNPRDIDICAITRSRLGIKDMESINHLFKSEKYTFHITFLALEEFIKSPPTVAKTILHESLSIDNKSFSCRYSLQSKVLYSYALSGLNASNKVRLVNILKGIKSEGGIVEKYGGEWLADGCFTIPLEADNDIISIFKQWNVHFKRKPIFLIG